VKEFLSYVGDPFKEAVPCVLRTQVHGGHEKAGHDKEFKPAKAVQEKVFGAAYEHMNDYV
jgi:hypothetical protein